MRLAVNNTAPQSPNRQELAAEVLRLAEAALPGAGIVAAFRNDQRRVEPVMTKELYKAFDELGTRAQAAATAEGGLILEVTARERIATIVAALRLKEWTRNVLQPIFETQWKRVADMAVMTLKREDVPVTMRTSLEQLILRHGGKRVGLLDIAEDTRTALFRVMDEGRAKGLNPRETARLIRDEVPAGRFTNAGASYRAQLIARTETLSAQRFSSLAMYKESPDIAKVIAFDGDKDAECVARNGTEYTISEAETEADITHPNCVLAFAPVV
jgi:hypothetical protein